jgi:hypothetical protein
MRDKVKDYKESVDLCLESIYDRESESLDKTNLAIFIDCLVSENFIEEAYQVRDIQAKLCYTYTETYRSDCCRQSFDSIKRGDFYK